MRLLLLSVLLVTVSTLPVFLTGAAFFQIGPELDIGPLGLGVLTAAFFLAAAVSSPPLGRWVQQVGWHRAMRINVVASAVLVGLVAPLAENVWTLAGLLVAAAVMYGSTNPAANLALARHTDPRWNATVFGLKHAGIPVSTLLAGLAVPTVVVGFGWRSAFVAAAVLALLVWFLIPPGQSDGVAPQGPARSPRSLTGVDLRRLALVASLGAVAAVALGTFMVSAALDRGVSESGAGWLQFAGSGVSVTARLIAGLAVDRWGGGLLGLVVLLGVGALVFAWLPWTGGAMFVVAVLVAYATGWGWPGLMTASVVGSDRQTAAATSAVTQAGVFVGAGGGPLVLGLVVERWSFTPMWLVVSACLVAATGLGSSILVGRRTAAA